MSLAKLRSTYLQVVFDVPQEVGGGGIFHFYQNKAKEIYLLGIL